MNTVSSEMESLKARLKATWMAGDFGRIAKHLEAGAEEFIARLALNRLNLDITYGRNTESESDSNFYSVGINIYLPA